MKRNSTRQEGMIAAPFWISPKADHKADTGRCEPKQLAKRSTATVGRMTALAPEIGFNNPALHERTDFDIICSVENILLWAAHVPANRITVTIKNGWITLAGTVTWTYQRKAAINAVQYLLGIEGVRDKITVQPLLSFNRLKADTQTAMKRKACDDVKKITVEVRGSDVILGGTVASWAERELATLSAWITPGVRRVVDNITVVS